MKKLSVITIVLFVAAIAMVGCKGNTELEFKNSELSDDRINDIVWADGDASWNSATGFNKGSNTGSKEVSETSGTVNCSVWTGTEYDGATVVFPNVGNGDSSSLSLNEGESNRFELQANL